MKKELLTIGVSLLAVLTAVACNSQSAVSDDETTNVHLYESTDASQRKPLNVKDFNAIKCGGVVDVHFTQAADYAASVDDPDDVLKSCYVSSYQLIIQTKNKKGNVRRPQLFLSAPSLRELNISGVSTFTTDSLNTGDIKLNLSGVCKVSFDVIYCNRYASNESGVSKVKGLIKAKEVELNCSGVAKNELEIRAGELSVESSGASKLNVQFRGNSVDIHNSGTSNLNINVDCDRLRAVNNGVAKLIISGTADDTKIDGSGVSRVDVSNLNKF